MTVARGALSEIWIAGSLQTNERFLSELAAHPWVREGIFHADFIDEEFLPALRPSPEMLQIFAALPAEHPKLGEVAGGSQWIVGDQWAKPQGGVIRWVDGPRLFELDGLPALSGRLRVADQSEARAIMVPMAADRWLVRVGEWVMTVRRTAGKKAPLKLFSLVSGRVHAVLFRAGSAVPAHESLVIVESLGMLVPHALPIEARILRWNVKAETSVRAGQELAEFEKAAKT